MSTGSRLVPGVAIDQHFAQRNRFTRTWSRLKRELPAATRHRQSTRSTAIAFEGKGCEVFGRGKVYLYPVAGEMVELGLVELHKFGSAEEQ